MRTAGVLPVVLLDLNALAMKLNVRLQRNHYVPTEGLGTPDEQNGVLCSTYSARWRGRDFWQVLMKMLNLAVERLETNRYMTPDEKYRNVRVVPHLLWWVLRFSLHVSLYWV